MRRIPLLLVPASMMLIVGSTGCQKTEADSVPSDSVKVGASAPASESPEALPPASAPSLDLGTKSCVLECVRARQMEAVGAEVIEANCKRECAENPSAHGK